MAECLRLTTGAARVAIWRVEEVEEELKAYIGGDSFPVLAQFQDPRRRLEWLAARCALKMLGIVDPVMYEPNRRPYVVNGKQNISISHSFPYVAVILSETFDVGLDIESLDRPFARISSKFLTFGEHSWIDMEDNLQLALVWSAKEAFFKLRLPPSFNPFSSLAVLPMQKPLGERGILGIKVALPGLAIQTMSMEYRVLDGFVLTWISCHPGLLPYDAGQGAEVGSVVETEES